MSAAVTARGIYKSYPTGFFKPKRPVLENISLEIEEGEIYTILGPNGAGKTTLISILSTLTLPDQGEVRIFGMKDAKRIRSLVNISSGSPNFPWSLTVEENLRYFSLLYGITKNRELNINDLIRALELEEHRHTRFDSLSTGTKQRLSLAKSLLNNPRLLFLDEPTLGLDPKMSRKIRSFIKKIHQERNLTIILTTHYMREAEELSNRVAFLKKGRIIAEDTPTRLKKQLKIGETIVIQHTGKIDQKRLQGVDGVLDIEAEVGVTRVRVESSEDSLDPILRILPPGSIKNVTVKEPDLEDVFLEFAK